MATLTVNEAAEGGGITFVSAAAAGDAFANDGKTIFVIYNDSVSASEVTATAQDTTATAPGFGAVTKADAMSDVEADSADVMGPFPKTAFNDANGRVVITYESETDMTVAAIRMP